MALLLLGGMMAATAPGSADGAGQAGAQGAGSAARHYADVRDLVERSSAEGALGERLVHNADGSQTSVPVGATEFLSHVAAALAHETGGSDTAVPGTRVPLPPDLASRAVGVGVADPSIAQKIGWPFCDVASYFAVYVSDLPAGATLQHIEQSPAGDVGAEPICGDAFGETHTYARVGGHIRGIGMPTNYSAACIVAEGLVPAQEPIGRAGGLSCDVRDVELRGNLVLDTESFGSVHLDYVLGAGNVVQSLPDVASSLSPDRQPICVGILGEKCLVSVSNPAAYLCGETWDAFLLQDTIVPCYLPPGVTDCWESANPAVPGTWWDITAEAEDTSGIFEFTDVEGTFTCGYNAITADAVIYGGYGYNFNAAGVYGPTPQCYRSGGSAPYYGFDVSWTIGCVDPPGPAPDLHPLNSAGHAGFMP